MWKSLSCVQIFVILWTIESMEFSRPEYWSGWPFPSPGDLPNPGIKSRSPAFQADSLPAEPRGMPNMYLYTYNMYVRVFPGGSRVKNTPANAGDTHSISGLTRSPGVGSGNQLQYSCLGNSMDRGARWVTVHGVTKSCKWLSNYHFTSIAYIYMLLLLWSAASNSLWLHGLQPATLLCP